jgi:hypothetical protein
MSDKTKLDRATLDVATLDGAAGPGPRPPWVPGLLLAVAVAVLAPLAVIFPIPQPARAVAALALLAWAPGYCIAVAGGIVDGLFRALVAIAISLGICVVASSSLLYLDVWSVSVTTYMISLVTILAALGARRASLHAGGDPAC